MSNFYRQFLELLPQQPLQVATVTAVDAAGCTVQMPDGAQARVRGSAAVGDAVFVRAGAIEGPAPSLTLVSITV